MTAITEMLNAPILQDSPLWLKARLGYLTASVMDDARALTKRDGKPTERYRNLQYAIIGERMTGRVREQYVSADMQRGLDFEQAARDALPHIGTIEPARWVIHPLISMFGATPDGFVGAHGLLEIKVPKVSTWMKWKFEGEIPEEYQNQMLAQLACTRKRWVFFVAYCPEMSEGKQLLDFSFEPLAKRIAECEADARKFLAEVDGMMKFLSV
jgi:hypothetical protein